MDLRLWAAVRAAVHHGFVDRNNSPTAAFAPQEIPLPYGRTLVVRAVTSADVDGLAQLYDGLDFDDRYRRFFSAYRPPRTFFEHLATAADRGGFGIVAVSKRTDDDDDGAIVAEANYSPLPDGDGELAVTVASAWRGWLGPYLLDALLEAAAARGVANLQADVLLSNSAMLALIRSRGYATMDHPDWTYVRVIIGTAGRTPVWPGPHDRPRVLVEVPGGRWPTEAAARKVGLQVLACPGPSGRRTPCPALAGSMCPLVAGADAIVVSHSPDDEQWRHLLDAHTRLRPGVPVCVEFLPDSAEASTQLRVPEGDPADAAMYVEKVARTGRGQTRG